MSTTTSTRRTTKGSAVTRTPIKNRKYGSQVTLLRKGKKVVAKTATERKGIYDTLRSLNINENFRTVKGANGYTFSKRYSKK